jgi:phage/plasmid primase-like uncharacterized protein
MKKTWLRKTSKTARKRREQGLDSLWKEAVMVKHGRRCAVCGARRVDVHHVRGKGAFPAWRWEVDNGLPLCRFHHSRLGERPTIARDFIEQNCPVQAKMYEREYAPALKTESYLEEVEQGLIDCITESEGTE